MSEEKKLLKEVVGDDNSYAEYVKSLTELNWDGNEDRGREGEDTSK